MIKKTLVLGGAFALSFSIGCIWNKLAMEYYRSEINQTARGAVCRALESGFKDPILTKTHLVKENASGELVLIEFQVNNQTKTGMAVIKDGVAKIDVM